MLVGSISHKLKSFYYERSKFCHKLSSVLCYIRKFSNLFRLMPGSGTSLIFVLASLFSSLCFGFAVVDDDVDDDDGAANVGADADVEGVEG